MFLDGLERMKRLPTVGGWERVEERANLALEQYFYGRATLDEAIEQIASETDGEF